MDQENIKHQAAAVSGKRHWFWLISALLFFGIAAIYAFTCAFSQFARYDDEGFMMITVRNFLDGNPLYHSVFTCYGPAYYLYEWLVHTGLNLPLSHNMTRLLCIAHWIGSAAILALACGWMTRSTLFGFFAFMQGTIHLRSLALEPGHPQELVLVLLALSIAVVALDSHKWRMMALGAIGAGLSLTKINVGAFFGIALLMSLGLVSSVPRNSRWLTWVLLALCSVLPLLLMRHQLSEPWAREYAIRSYLAIFTASSVGYLAAEGRAFRLMDLLQIGISFFVVATLIVTIILVQGTSFRDFLDGIILGAIRLENAFTVPLEPLGSISLSASLLGGIIVWYWQKYGENARVFLSLLKGVYGLLGTIVFVSDAKFQLCVLLPWAWLLLVGKIHQPMTSDRFPRTFLCLLAVWQGLQAYPVAGTQMCIGTFLLVAVCSLCLNDAVLEMGTHFNAQFRLVSVKFGPAGLTNVAIGLLFYLFVLGWTKPLEHWQYYSCAPSLNLPGASLLRLDETSSQRYANVTDYLNNHCDTFLVFPGLNSLYFWTGKKPPACVNLSGEGVLPDPERQAAIIDGLKRAQRPLVVLRQVSWAKDVHYAGLKEGPLAQFIREAYCQVDAFGEFRVLAPKDSAEWRGSDDRLGCNSPL